MGRSDRSRRPFLAKLFLFSGVSRCNACARLRACVVPIFRYLRYLSNTVSGFSRRRPEGAEGGDI
jgi:hypothetical protein